MSGIITFQLCLISHIWIIFVLLKSCHGQITNSRCESSRSHSDDRSQTSLYPVLRSQTTERKKTEQSRKMSERRPSRTRQRSSGMSAMFFLPPTPFLLHLSSSLLLHLLPLSTLVWTQLSSFLSNVTPMIRARRSRHSENSS